MPIYNSVLLEPNPANPTQHRHGPSVLAHQGPNIPVELSIPDALANYFSQQNVAIPAPLTGVALIDTGASITCVDISIIQSLNIQPIGTTTVYTPQGNATQQLFPIKLSFPGTAIVISLNAVLGSVLLAQNIGALIGRDILSRCVLVYNGPLGSFSFSI